MAQSGLVRPARARQERFSNAVQLADLHCILCRRRLPLLFPAVVDRTQDGPRYRELPFLCGLEPAVCRAAVGFDDCRLDDRTSYCGNRYAAPQTPAGLIKSADQSRPARLLQVRGLSPRQLRHANGSRRHRFRAARCQHRPANRYLVLYVSDLVLHAGCLSWPDAPALQLARLLAVCVFLPATCRRTDRARQLFPAAMHRAASRDARRDGLGSGACRIRPVRQDRPC